MRAKKKKQWVVAMILMVILFTSAWGIINQLDFSSGQKVIYGVTFSHKYSSENLKLPWTEVYWEILNDLGVKDIRLAVHWDKLEERQNEYNFTDWEWMVEKAAEKEARVIMAIGRRTPRWPECHDPKWIKDLGRAEQNEQTLLMIEKVVKHFKKYKNIVAWQVENEPLLNVFGECPKADKELLKKEIALVKSLDERPVIITDTGELSDWQEAASMADIFGTTMYKTIWNSVIGVWRYPLPPAYYYYKAKRISEKYNLAKIIVAELQAEPWVAGGGYLSEMQLNEQLNLYDERDFKNNLEYVKRAGFTEVYLWGVEWWYWLKKEKNTPIFWEMGKKIWQE